MTRDAGARLREVDAEARRLAVTEFERPLVLEAGAGTGKTAVLVHRVLGWALGPGFERHRKAADLEAAAKAVLDGVVALTFTEAAAAEMAERTAAGLLAVSEGRTLPGLELEIPHLGPDDLRRRARALLASIERLQATTIHAWCRRLLAARPLEAGLHPAFTVDAEGQILRGVVDEALAAWWSRAFGDPGAPDARLLLERSDVGPDEIAAAVRALAADGVDPATIPGDPFAPDAVARAARDAKATLSTLGTQLGARFFEEPFARAKVTAAVRDALADAAALIDAATTLAALREAMEPLSSEAVEKRLGEWAHGRIGAGEAAAMAGRPAAVAAAARAVRAHARLVRAADPELMTAAVRVVKELLGRVRERLRARGVCTFQDLLSGAHRLLVAAPGVLADVRASIDQLLIDEFQDTDPLQYAIVQLLALDGPAAARPGLFLVGDPKQSIYAWRRADLAAYERFLERLEKAGGRRLGLHVNHRSVTPILDEVERLLAPAMAPEPGVQPRFEALVASPRNSGRSGFEACGRRPVEHWTSWRRPTGEGATRPLTADEARQLEAGAIAADIRELRDGELVAYGDVAILLRTTTPQDIYLEALRSAGIPYAVERDRSFYRRREITEAVALLGAILDPNDHIALVATLRSPAVGVPDAALIPLWRRGFPARMSALRGPDRTALAALEDVVDGAAAAMPPGVPGIERIEGWPLALKAAIRAIAAARGAFGNEPADRFVERIRASFLGEATEAARFPGRLRVANLEKLFGLFLDALRAHEGGPEGVLRELRASLAEERDEEEARIAGPDLDAVRVMTIHKAKGLTFGHCYLAGLHGRTGTRGIDRRPRVVVDQGGVEVALFGQESLGFARVREREERVRRAEEVRALYVAATRPAKRLVLLGARAPGRETTLDEVACHADLIALREGGVPEDALLLSGSGTHEEAYVDDQGVLWRVPPPAEDGGRRLRSGASEGEAAAAGSSVARRLGGLRAEAARRQRRRRVEGVTGGIAAAEPALEEDEGEPEHERGTPRAADEARALGVAMHRILEALDLRASPAAEIERLAPAAAAMAASGVPAARAEAVAGLVRAMAARLTASPLAERLAAVAPRVLARELPYLARSEAAGDEGPVDAWAGTIDLLYVDPESGLPVVAEFKTDRVRGGEDLAAKAQRHAPQGRAYARAVQRALGLEAPPKVEIWFLDGPAVVPLQPADGPDAEPARV